MQQQQLILATVLVLMLGLTLPLLPVIARHACLHARAMCCSTAAIHNKRSASMLQEASGRTPQRSFFGRVLAAMGGGPQVRGRVLGGQRHDAAALPAGGMAAGVHMGNAQCIGARFGGVMASGPSRAVVSRLHSTLVTHAQSAGPAASAAELGGGSCRAG